MKKPEFREALERHKDMVYNLAFYLTGRRDDADDVTQDVLIGFWRNFEKIEGPSRKAWLLKSTRNKAFDCLRKRKRRRFMDATGDAAENDVLEAALPPTPETRLMESERARLLAELIRRLPDLQREIVLMHDVEGIPVRTAAEALGIPENTAKVYLHRGRKRLLRMMDPDTQSAIE